MTTIATPTMPKPKWASAFQTGVSVGKPKSILLYGTHGTRKTSIASSIAKVPGFKRVLHIDIDNGTEVLANDPVILKKIEDGEYNVLSINPLEPGAKAKFDSVIDDITTIDYGYDAVILDTLDIAQDVAEKQIKRVHEGSKNTFAVYGDLGVWTDELVRKLHDSAFFTAVITSHEKENAADDGSVKVTPRLSGSSKDAIGGIPSIVAHLGWQAHPDTGDLHLVATLGEHQRYISKQRFNLPSQLLDTDLVDIYDRITKKSANTAASK